jgi:hypothetical protein
MESPVEIRYAGVVIGRAQEIRGSDGDSSFFLVVRDPMPVGSVVHLRTGDRETPARVIHTVESADAAAAGIQVRLIGEAEEVATEWIPPPAPVEKARPAEEPPKTAMPVIEVAIPVAPAKVAVGVDTRLRSEGKAEAQQTDFAFDAAPASEAAPVPEAAPEAAPAEAAPAEAAPAPEAAAVSASEPVAAVVVEEAPVVTTAPYGQTATAAAAPPSTEASDGVVQAPIEHKLVDANESAAPAEAVPAPAAPAASEDVSPVGDLPPARPIAGPSGRRKTKRRR